MTSFAGQKGLSEEERFWPKVVVTGFCWLWAARKSDSGHGLFSLSNHGRTVRAHRWAYESLVGPIPEGLDLDHLCRIRACVNPDHLEPVTRKENTLRGFGVTAIFSRQDYCTNGHSLLISENVYIRKDGTRQCRVCKRERMRRYKKEAKWQSADIVSPSTQNVAKADSASVLTGRGAT